MKLQEKYDLSYKEAKEKSKEIAKFTETKGINTFDKAMAVYASSVEGGGKLSTQEALISGNISNTKLNGKGADSLGRDDREQLTQDIADKIMANYKKNNKKISDQEARKQAEKLIKGTNEYAKNL